MSCTSRACRHFHCKYLLFPVQQAAVHVYPMCTQSDVVTKGTRNCSKDTMFSLSGLCLRRATARQLCQYSCAWYGSMMSPSRGAAWTAPANAARTSEVRWL